MCLSDKKQNKKEYWYIESVVHIRFPSIQILKYKQAIGAPDVRGKMNALRGCLKQVASCLSFCKVLWYGICSIRFQIKILINVSMNGFWIKKNPPHYDANKTFLCPRDRRSGGILFLSCLSFCHSVILSFHQSVILSFSLKR